MERHATYSPAITPGELEALKSLRAAGEQRGICYKIDPGTENGVLLWEEGVLTGYMTLNRFGGQEAESAAVVASGAAWIRRPSAPPTPCTGTPGPTWPSPG